MATETPTNAIQRATTEIENTLASCNAMALREMPALSQAVTLATGITTLRKVLTEDLVKQVFMPLQGSPLGFVTDKDKEGGYGIGVVRDCLIEAMIHGLRPVGNELNIISGRCYAAKNGLVRLVSEFPGVSDLVYVPGVPQMVADKGAIVPFRITWRLNGKPMERTWYAEKRPDGTVLDNRIAVRVNAGMGADAVIGKAIRKAFKQVLDQLTGSKFALGEGEAIDTMGEVVSEPTAPPVPPEQDGRRIKMGGTGKNGEPASAPAAAPEAKPDPSSGEVPASQEPPAREPGAEG